MNDRNVGPGDGTEVLRLADLDPLSDGAKRAAYSLGFLAARAVEKHGAVTVAVDVLGNLRFLPAPPGTKARLSDDELDALPEEDAASVLLAQGDGDRAVLDYLEARSSRAGRSA